MSFKKWIQFTAVLTMSFLALNFNSAAAKKPVVLNTQIGEEIRHLDPQAATGIGSSYINTNLFSGLFNYHHKTNEPVKEMVKSYTKNKDATVWTFKLRKDFHWVALENGKVIKKRPVTAHDFVYSFRRMVSPALAAEYAAMLYIIKNAEPINKGKVKDLTKLGAKALDDYTFQVTLEGPVPSFIQYLPHSSFTAVPKEPIEKHKEAWIKAGNIWTNGSYTFKEWKLKDKISVVKNPHHPDAATTQVDHVNFNFIGTYSPEAVRAFRAGKNDIDYQDPPTSEIAPLKKEKTLKAARQLGTYYVRVNVTRGPMKDKRVRRALALVIPRTKIVRYVMKSGQIPTVSFVPNAFQSQKYNAKRFTEERSYKNRVAKAKKLLADAGYPNGKGFPKVKYLYNTADNHKKIAVILSKTWKKELGIDVTPFNQEWKVYLNTQKAIDFDLSRSGWIADMADPMNFLEMFITGGGNNQTGFSNAEYDKLIKAGQIEGNLAKRAKLMERAEEILMDELPVLPIFNYTALSLVQPYIKGFYASKMDKHPLKFVKVDTAKREKIFPGAVR